MWNEKAELVKHARKIAEENHPDGYNKKQLIDASKEVFGGYSANPLKTIKTMDDVGNMGNHMAYIDGHYPVGMSECYVVGLNGGCGIACPVFHEGDCGEPQEINADEIVDEFGEEEGAKLMGKYTCFNEYLYEHGISD
jgi:hypothetical protein